MQARYGNQQLVEGWCRCRKEGGGGKGKVTGKKKKRLALSHRHLIAQKYARHAVTSSLLSAEKRNKALGSVAHRVCESWRQRGCQKQLEKKRQANVKHKTERRQARGVTKEKRLESKRENNRSQSLS